LSEPVASVVMPARDAADTIAVQLAALAAQPDSERLEVIVVDNGSRDDTSGVARAWGDRLPGLRVLVAAERPNAGYARNVGVAAAQCETVLLCDADDRVERGWSRALLHELEDADSVAGLTVGWDGTAPSLRAPQDAVPPGRAGNLPLSFATRYGFLPAFGSNNAALKKSVWAALGGFDETLRCAEDVDLSWRLQLAGFSLSFAPDAIVHGRERATPVAAFEQAFRYGQCEVGLFVGFRSSGMPRSSTRDGLRRLASLVRHLPEVTRGNGARLTWCARSGFRWGRVVGSVQHRACYL
jgi:glycosyltransferase involved in cell wall biosynthesis